MTYRIGEKKNVVFACLFVFQRVRYLRISDDPSIFPNGVCFALCIKICERDM